LKIQVALTELKMLADGPNEDTIREAMSDELSDIMADSKKVK
jgi:hypothetical protein